MSGRSIRNKSRFAGNKFLQSGFIVILIALLQAACSSNTDRSAPSQPPAPPQTGKVESLSYEVRTVEKKDPNCTQTQAQCTYIRFVYPEMTGGPASVKAAINKAVSDFLLKDTEEGPRFDTVEDAMNGFIANYQKFKNEFPDAPYTYKSDKEIKVANQSPRIISLDFNHTWFTGGAHPNLSRMLASYDATTGEKIKLSDLLVADYKSRLDEIGEKKFREVRRLTADMSLSEAGFNFKDGTFTLNDNFYADKDGLTFYFNPYEIAAYAVGPTEFTLSYSDIKSLIKADGPLADLLN
jgi:hypothetical protein